VGLLYLIGSVGTLFRVGETDISIKFTPDYGISFVDSDINWVLFDI